MKIKYFLLFVMFLFQVVEAQNSSFQLKVMTYNIRFGELATLSEISSFIKNEEPDLVALQECDWKVNRERALHQKGKAYINEIAYYTELFGLYGKAINYKGGYYGVGLLSKYPIIKSERILLPNPEHGKEQRVLLIAEIELPNDKLLTFICTHLEVSSSKTRLAQIKFINEEIKKIKTPILLAGDFNTTPHDIEIKNGFVKWNDLTDTTYTFSTKQPTIKIDYIYGYPYQNFKLVSTNVYQDCKLSDHFPVSSIITYINN
ncbi:endonuclease/exonuclease/phosphatase family protein [Porphyromonadaceae sp. NP-X]|jgi:endonuclease/exonuclease/phosphatase family metal-dependent hydrolase|nr:endonuclease/exonuclease/phosphatase family protein [Porphyromonadaceae sp. NP-X]